MAADKNKSLQDSLKKLGKRVDKCRAAKPGDIDLHLSGDSGVSTASAPGMVLLRSIARLPEDPPSVGPC